jgi:iron(III) transport system substrate-binding protein
MLRCLAIVAAWFVLTSAAQAQLVIDGELISDQATFAAAKAEGRLSIYGTYPADAMNPILSAFEADTGIKTDFTRLSTQSMFVRTTTEFAAGRLEADYVDLTDLTLIQKLVDLGILNVPHRVPSFDAIPDAIKDPQGRWYGMIRIVSVIAINLSRAGDQNLPTAWKDLLDPRWKGLIGTPSNEQGGSAFTLHAFLREKVDPAFWPKFAAQKPRIYNAVVPLSGDLARGELAIGIGAILEPVLAQIKAGAPLKAVFPSEGVPVFACSGGIASTAKHPHAAALFVDWLTSKRGGNVIAKVGAYGANPASDVPNAPDLRYPPPSQLWNIKSSDWVRIRDPWMAEWLSIFKGEK